MRCLYKDIECEYAGEIIYSGCKEFGEKEGIRRSTYCYNDSIGMDITKCRKGSK